MLARGNTVQKTARPIRGTRLIKGKTGNPGVAGDQLFIGVPDDGTGKDGDVYIDTGTKMIFKKTGGSYGTGTPYA